jgi:predicted RNA-binding Zn-ribbon protein involved in translation (DUF1610 family)
MSSMARSIRREMKRNSGRIALAAGRLTCPKCGKRMARKGLSFRQVKCVGCGLQGRVK